MCYFCSYSVYFPVWWPLKCSQAHRKPRSWCIGGSSLEVQDLTVILFFFNLPFIYVIFLEKEMATHFSILAWKIPWTEEPCGLQFTGSQRVGHNWTHTHPWNPKNADVFPIPSRCFLLPKTRKGEHLSRELQVTKFSSPASTPFKS